MQCLLIRSACTYDLVHPFLFTWLCRRLLFFSCLHRLLSIGIEKKTDPIFIYRHMNLLEMSLLALLLWDTALCRQRNMNRTFWGDIIQWLLPPAFPWCVFVVRPGGSSGLKELKEVHWWTLMFQGSLSSRCGVNERGSCWETHTYAGHAAPLRGNRHGS